jgi:hypothetical protein
MHLLKVVNWHVVVFAMMTLTTKKFAMPQQEAIDQVTQLMLQPKHTNRRECEQNRLNLNGGQNT